MEINNVGHTEHSEHSEHAEHGAYSKVKKNTKFLYFLQFLMTLFQVWVLAYYIAGWQGSSGLENSLWIWTAFILPMVAGNVMWNNESKEVSKAKFFIQGGYQLTLFVMYGIILGFWK